MSRSPRKIVFAFLVLILSILLGIAATLTLIPIWRWFEGATGIESLGHSGPAIWCYLVSSTVILGVCGGIVGARSRRRR
jgi:hypothetical protein